MFYTRRLPCLQSSARSAVLVETIARKVDLCFTPEGCLVCRALPDLSTCGDNCATIILSSREMRLGRRQQPTCSSQGTLPFSLRGPHRLVSSLVSCRNTVNLMTIICLHTHRTCVSNTNSSQVIGHYTGHLLDILVII